MITNKMQRSFATHDGKFHADDVTACALLLLYNLIDDDKIFRTRSPQVFQKCQYICDIGDKYIPEKYLFDHHQRSYQGTLSSAGMILKHLLDTGVMNKEEYDFFNEELIIGIDSHDNGLEQYIYGYTSFSQVVASFNLSEGEKPEQCVNCQFFEALEFVLAHLRRIKKKFDNLLSFRDDVFQAMQNSDNCIIFDKQLPWMYNFFKLDGKNHKAKFVIMPDGKCWKLRGIPPNKKDPMKVRQYLPQIWAGKRDEELKNVSGIDEAIFCHKGRFISIWKTKEAAIKAMNITLNTNSE